MQSRWFLCTIICLGAQFADGRAEAQAAVAGFSLCALAEPAFLAGGIVTGTGGMLSRRSQRPNRRWLVADYVFGALNLAAGITAVTMAFTLHDGSGLQPLDAPTGGITAGEFYSLLACGGVALTIAVVDFLPLLLGPPKGPSVTLTPIVGRDSSNQMFAGLGIRIVDF